MRIAVTTPTGHVGSAVADFLLGLGDDVHVTLLGRRPERLKEFVRRGAKVAVGSQDDVAYLVESTRGIDALFLATPPGYGSDNLRAFQNRLGRAAAAAIVANEIPRVVNLSSIGAHLSEGVGPINGLHDVEELLNEACTNVVHLRPGFFFENLLWQIEPIRNHGIVALPISGSRSYPMIATRDIARVAASHLATSNWEGRFARELHGPADMTFDEVAATLTEVLGRTIFHVHSDPADARQAMMESAMSDSVIELMLELYDAIDSGKLQPQEPRSSRTTTPTTLAEFARAVMLPLLAEPAAQRP